MATRNGKIANLPIDIREQLNLRLLEGETGRELAAWLNDLPAVQSILGSQFNGSPISEVNLTLWRQGGYLQWLTERECFDSARALADGDCNLAETGFSAERLLNVLTLRIGQLLMRWDLSPDGGASTDVAFSGVARKARILQGISRSLLAIHRIQSQSARQKSEPAISSANSRARSEEHAPSSPATAGEIPRTQLEAQPNGTVLPTAPKSAEPPRRGAGGGTERGEPPRRGAGGGTERGEPPKRGVGGGKESESIRNSPSLAGEAPFRRDQGSELAERLMVERKGAGKSAIRDPQSAIGHTSFKPDFDLGEVHHAV